MRTAGVFSWWWFSLGVAPLLGLKPGDCLHIVGDIGPGEGGIDRPRTGFDKEVHANAVVVGREDVAG